MGLPASLEGLAERVSVREPFLKRHATVGMSLGLVLAVVTVAVGVAAGGLGGGIARFKGRWLGLLVGGVMVGCGLAGLGVGHLRAARLAEATAPTPAGKVTTGRVVVSGTVAADDCLLRTPFTGREAVAVVWEVSEQAPVPDEDRTSTRWTGRDARRFHVEDDSGRVLVDPAEATLDVDGPADREATITVEGEEDPPERIREWLWDHQHATSEWGRAYREWWLAPGDDVSVLGTATGADSGDVVVDSDHRSSRFVVGRGTPEARAVAYRRRGVVDLCAGGAVALGCYALLVTALGVV